MGIRTATSALAVLVVAAAAALTGAASTAAPDAAPTSARAKGPVGLWDTDFRAGLREQDCGRWRLDDRGFCTANDWRNGVELGTRFRATREVSVVGVRVYRVDPATVTGSLWDALGNRIATGTFAPAARKGWQDLTFHQPVTIMPGQVYIASYYTPGTKYAFEYDAFDHAITRGPITALRATNANPNGVHCYDVAPCTSPTDEFRSSNYWVTPLWRETGAPTPTPTPTPTPPSATAPLVHAAAPSAGAKRVSRSASIKVTFSKKLRKATLNRSTVRLQRKGKPGRVPMKLRYSAARNRLTLVPRHRLLPRTTYRVVITSKVRDRAGNPLDQDPQKPGVQRAAWTFRTR